MTIERLPRPWMLAALTDVPVTVLARQSGGEADADQREQALPRPEPRRRRLAARQFAGARADQGHGRDLGRAA